MQISLEVRIPNTPLFRGDGPRIVREELLAATEDGVNMVLGAVLPLTPVDQGILRGGFQTEVLGAAAGGAILGRVYNPVIYAPAQEGGAKPHFPPVAALEGWVRRKLQVSEKEVRSVAFLVARAIARRGLPAREFARRGLESVRARVNARFEQARSRIVERLGGR